MSNATPPSRPGLRVAVTQWHAMKDVDRNLEVATDLIAMSGAQGAELVLLPENGLTLGTNAEMRAAAICDDGPELARLSVAAKAAGTTVILGGAKYLADGAAAARNRAVVIGPDGAVLGGYDKVHLFDARVGGTSFEASSVEEAGSEPVLVQLPSATLGLTICYDVRFPELYRQLALSGAEVFLVPSAFTRITGQAHWETLLRARAIENAAYVVASATVSGLSDQADDAFPTYGHALVVDPWGQVLADLGDEPLAYQVLDLDLNTVARTRAKMPVLQGVRPEAYATPPRSIAVGA